MNYIINPNWFYWINVLGDAKDLAIVLGILAAIGWGVSTVVAAVNYELGYKFKEDSE